MSTHMTKTWFVDGEIIEQEIPESEIYKRESWPFPQRDENGDIIIPPKPVPIREDALF